MKVLSVIDTLETGGAEKSLREIYRRFQSCEVVVCHLYPGDHLAASYRAAGLRTLSLDLPGKYSFLAAVRGILAVIDQEQPTLLVSTLFRASMICRVAARRSGLPLVDSFVNDSYSAYRWRALAFAGRAKLRAIWLLDALTARWATGFTAVSAHVRDSNCRALRLAPDKVTVIRRGRDPDLYQAQNERRFAVRSALGASPGQPLLLNVARLLPRKGQRELLHAMSPILRVFPEAQLLLVGDGHDRGPLEALAQDLGLGQRIRFLGVRDDVPDLLSAADVFVFPSHFEGHAGALIEAMLAGRAIVATDTASHRESLTDGETARLVPVGSPEALARAVIEVLAEPEAAARMGRRACEVAQAHFHIEQIAAYHEALYTKVAEGRR